MKTLTSTFLLLALVSASSAAETVLLRLRPVDGPLIVESRHRKVQGGVLGGEAVARERDDVVERFTRTQVDADGALQVRVKSVSRQLELDGVDHSEAYDFATEGREDAIFRVDPLGRVLEEYQGVTPAELLTLPPGPVAVGETWAGELAPTEGRPFPVPLTFRLEALEDAGRTARIAVRAKGKRRVRALGAWVRWKIRGEVHFDVAGGFVRKDRGEQSYEVRYRDRGEAGGLAYRSTERHEVSASAGGE